MSNDYSKKQAGGLVTTKVPTVLLRATIAEVEQTLLKHVKDFNSVNYVYVVDGHRQLQGVISVKDIFRHAKNTSVQEVIPKQLITVPDTMSRERAVYEALKHGIKEVPVIDKEGVFVGAIPNDVIMRLTYHEAHDDLMKLAGIRRPDSAIDTVFELSIFKSLTHRLPWLLIGLLGGMIAARIISSFEATLNQNLILAAFIPLIVYMSDAVGTQLEAFIIRDLVTHPRFHFAPYLLRQFGVLLLIAIIMSLTLLILSVTWYGDLVLGGVLSLSLFCALLSSVITGICIPYLFSRFHLDPADASGPVATIIQDIFSILIYFSVASLLL